MTNKNQAKNPIYFKSIRELDKQDIYTLYLVVKSRYRKLSIYSYFSFDLVQKLYYIAENINLLINIINKKVEYLNIDKNIMKFEMDVLLNDKNKYIKNIDDINSDISFYNHLKSELIDILNNIKDTLVVANKTYTEFSIDYINMLMKNNIPIQNQQSQQNQSDIINLGDLFNEEDDEDDGFSNMLF